ncbi:helix-turn-helix domain-containing protein [Natrialbaceae archaeon GCM10025810]
MNPSDYTGRGDLPDALAFVKPNRAECWIALDARDEPATAYDLERDLEWSGATIYRMLKDLMAAGLVEEVVTIGENGPSTAYRATEPEGKPEIRTDGGSDLSSETGRNPQLGPDGTCWNCEDAAPGSIARITVGPLSMLVAVCEDCDEELEEEFGDDDRDVRTDGGTVTDVTHRSDCPLCDDGGRVIEAPEAGYATCVECGERGYWRDDGTEWWRNDPDSMWYVEPGTENDPETDGGESDDWTPEPATLRDGEPTDDETHASRTAEQLAMADAEMEGER